MRIVGEVAEGGYVALAVGVGMCEQIVVVSNRVTMTFYNVCLST